MPAPDSSIGVRPRNLLLATKLYIPPPRPNLVPRPRLLERLDQGLNARLILVSAPAGFGKTTLLSEWISQRQGDQETRRPGEMTSSPLVSPSPCLPLSFAWLSLDAGDNDPVRFLGHVIVALCTIVSPIGETANELLCSPQPPPVESILTVLLNELCALPDDAVLVLDDYHAIDNAAIHDAVTFLLDHLPPQNHLVIATRADPPLSLARWRSRGQLVEIRTDDLRFTPDESVAFLSQVMGLNLSAQDVATLEARTEGWIVGLQMAGISLQGRTDTDAFVQAFSGSHHYVLDYLVEEVLSRQPENAQAFLLQTSILDRLCGPLCDEVIGIGDQGAGSRDQESSLITDPRSLVTARSQEILEYLERSNLFLVPLDDERRWYRYHHLFAELLRARLAQSHGEQHVEMLHTRAAAWYEANGFPAEAIHHALAAHDYDRAARVIESIADSAWLNGEFSQVLRWIEALPGKVMRSRPWVCIWYAWSRLQSGTVQGVEEMVADVERMNEARLRDQPAHSCADSEALMEQIAALRVTCAGLRQETGKTIELARRALERSPVDNRVISFMARCNVLNVLGFAYYVTGELSQAEQTYQEAKKATQEIGFLLRDILVTHKLAHIHQVTGRLHQPYRLYQETLACLQAQGKGKFFAMGYLYCGMSSLLYEWDRLEEAQQVIAESIRLNETAEVPHLLVDSYNAQARLFIAQRDLDAAQAALEKAVDLIQKYYCWPEVVGANESYQVRLWLTRGDLTSAVRWAQGHQPDNSEVPAFARELGEIARARVLIAQGLPNEATGLLDRLARSAEMGGRNGRLIEILVLQVMALQAQNKAAHALTVLEKALRLAEPEGYVRVFVDEGPSMAALLRQAVSRSGVPDYASRLLAAFGAERRGAAEREPTPALIEPLSERERQVLRLLAGGLSNQEIAGALVVAVGTVKVHIHNIYGKLGARSRTQAIARARELSML